MDRRFENKKTKTKKKKKKNDAKKQNVLRGLSVPAPGLYTCI